MKKFLVLFLMLVLCLGAMTSTASAREKIEFWFHAANETSNAEYEKLFGILNEIQDEYEFVYTGFASSNFADFSEHGDCNADDARRHQHGLLQHYQLDRSGRAGRHDPLLRAVPEKDYINASLLDSLKSIGKGALYGVPYNYNQDIIWYNTKLFAENGIEAAPSTISEFMAMCEKYADPDNGKYFYSLRGVKPGDNLIGFIFSYADNGGAYFDENGKCVLNQPKFVEGLELYASLYKNGWVSGDSVNNNYNEMVAEFGAGTSMMIMHNSSSRSNHVANLGDGNLQLPARWPTTRAATTTPLLFSRPCLPSATPRAKTETTPAQRS